MKNKHQQVVDLSNPNEGQGTSASTSAFKIRHNMSKQTAVEWLMIELFTMNSLTQQIIDTFEQAKEMHRQEIIDANLKALCQNCFYGVQDSHRKIAEKYYTQTFGKKTFLDLVSNEVSPVHELVRKVKEKKATNKEVLDAAGQSYQMMQEAKRNDDNKARLKEGDIIEISGYYFNWVIVNGYSELLKKDGIYASAQGGLIHSNLEGDRILSINGKKIK
jgi:hypothetical protein